MPTLRPCKLWANDSPFQAEKPAKPVGNMFITCGIQAEHIATHKVS